MFKVPGMQCKSLWIKASGNRVTIDFKSTSQAQKYGNLKACRIESIQKKH